LHTVITQAIKPVTIFDKIHVREFVDKLWQQQRCKRSVASLVEGAYMVALASLLRPFNSPTIEFGEDAASKMARDYYSGEANAKKMEAVELLLAQCGITEDQVRAKAMQLCGGGVLMFNRMETYCENTLRKLQKENNCRTADESHRARGSDQPANETVK
jgi:hypothetical protein